MKLTLVASGGIGGLKKSSSLDVDSLSLDIKSAIKKAFDDPITLGKITNSRAADNFNYYLKLDGKEVKLPETITDKKLKKLLDEMKDSLTYEKR